MKFATIVSLVFAGFWYGDDLKKRQMLTPPSTVAVAYPQQGAIKEIVKGEEKLLGLGGGGGKKHHKKKHHKKHHGGGGSKMGGPPM